MNIDALYASGPSTSTGLPPASSELDKDAFLKLLVQQLQNQDPMEPTPNEQFISQLATFSTLEEMQLMNENVLGLAVLQQGNALLSQLTQSSALIGKQVDYIDPTTQQPKSGAVSSVLLQDGQAFLQVGDTSVPLASVTKVYEAPAPDDAAPTDDEAGEVDESDAADETGETDPTESDDTESDAG